MKQPSVVDHALTATPEEIEDAYSQTASEARSSLEEMGIRVPDCPMNDRPSLRDGEFYSGQLPSNLDELSNSEIVEVMAKHLEWIRYINGHLADSQVKKKIAARKVKAVESSVATTRGKDAVDSDRRCLQASAFDLSLHDARLTYLEAIKANAAQDYKTLSRIITIRGLDQEAQMRINSVQKGFPSARPGMIEPQGKGYRL